ncbi:hypothetical protein JXL21_13165 [Candidatus Bathyarchaeota archaeon]|nr:hypothetical protein [Candidatus Bathyarchaeota archaeon]
MKEPTTTLSQEEKRSLFRYLIKRYPRLTVKIILGYSPDGMDRLTIALGHGSEYDYRLLDDDGLREAEVRRYLGELKSV